MIVNNEMEIKFFYRFIEFTSKLLGVDLPHERFKLLALSNYKAESKLELQVKSFAEAYLYLINNINQVLTKTIIKKTYFILTDKILEEEKCKNILEEFYKNYDETSHHLATLIHFKVLDSVEDRKIEFSFMMSNLVMMKKKNNPLIPYAFMFDSYFKSIKDKNFSKLMCIFVEIEANSKPKYNYVKLSQELIIEEIKKCNSLLKCKYNVKKLYLYGSFAKEKITESSDLDLLVIYDKKLLNFERCKNNGNLINYLSNKLQINVDLIDFTHAMENMDINEMENIITII